MGYIGMPRSEASLLVGQIINAEKNAPTPEQRQAAADAQRVREAEAAAKSEQVRQSVLNTPPAPSRPLPIEHAIDDQDLAARFAELDLAVDA